MNGLGILFLVLALACVAAIRDDWGDVNPFTFIGVVLFLFLAWFVRDTPESLARDAERAKAEEAQRIAEITPRRLSEKDGCTVYTFKPQDRWLYFTRCGNETTTQNEWTVRSGKTTRTETMEIKTK